MKLEIEILNWNKPLIITWIKPNQNVDFVVEFWNKAIKAYRPRAGVTNNRKQILLPKKWQILSSTYNFSKHWKEEQFISFHSCGRLQWYEVKLNRLSKFVVHIEIFWDLKLTTFYREVKNANKKEIITN